MDVNKIYEWRRQGRIEEAYNAARQIYAIDKGERASSLMFWTAVDMLKRKVLEKHMEEARKIYKALERLMTGVEDKEGWMADAMKKCKAVIKSGETREELLRNGPDHIKMGVWGEDMAAAYLQEQGYVIVERDWHSQHRDIDIIAQHDNCLVFIEVKTRRNRDLTEPEEAVNYKKQKNLRLAINHYIQYRNLDIPWRFDVITVVGRVGDEKPEIVHLEDFALLCG